MIQYKCDKCGSIYEESSKLKIVNVSVGPFLAPNQSTSMACIPNTEFEFHVCKNCLAMSLEEINRIYRKQ